MLFYENNMDFYEVQEYISPVRFFKCQCYCHNCYGHKHAFRRSKDVDKQQKTDTSPDLPKKPQATTTDQIHQNHKYLPCTAKRYVIDHKMGSRKSKSNKNEVDRLKNRTSYD